MDITQWMEQVDHTMKTPLKLVINIYQIIFIKCQNFNWIFYVCIDFFANNDAFSTNNKSVC